MASSLEDCTLEEQRAVIRFLFSEGTKPSEIHSRMKRQYGKSCINRANFYKWIDRYKLGRTNVSDVQRSGRPIEVSNALMENRIETLIQEDRRITVAQIAETCHTSVGTVHSIIHDKLKYRKTCARWVPKLLTDNHKNVRLNICQELKRRYQEEGEAFLERIVTCDETWIHHFEPESKRQSMEWKHVSSPVRKKFKTQPKAGKVMLTIFWDFKGPIFCDYLETQRTVNGEYYREELEVKVKPAILSKRRGLQTKGVLFLQDNARPHKAYDTLDTIERLNWEVLPHPPYSPDLAPSDFHLFGPMKEFLRGKRFENNEDVKATVQVWLRRQGKEFFAEGIKKLVQRWEKCINVGGTMLKNRKRFHMYIIKHFNTMPICLFTY